MEQRMQRSQEDLLKRLGEARTLSGDRQNAALFDVLQQMMREQAELQRYLVQSRSVWTGDVGDEVQQDGDQDMDAPATDTRAPNNNNNNNTDR
jgi:hypothetical protein